MLFLKEHRCSFAKVLKKHFVQYIKLFDEACQGQEKSPKIACYTRFLAVIRPDFFVPINKKNEVRIRQALNSRAKISVDNYWEMLQEIHKIHVSHRHLPAELSLPHREVLGIRSNNPLRFLQV